MLSLFAEIKAALAALGAARAAAVAVLSVLSVPLAMVRTLWGATASRAGHLDLADLRQVVVMLLTFLAGGLATGSKVFAFSSMVLGDLGSVNLAISSILAGLAAAVAKWLTPGTAPRPAAFVLPDSPNRTS